MTNVTGGPPSDPERLGRLLRDLLAAAPGIASLVRRLLTTRDDEPGARTERLLPTELIETLVSDEELQIWSAHFAADIAEAGQLATEHGGDLASLGAALDERQLTPSVLAYLAERAFSERQPELAARALGKLAKAASADRTGAVEGMGRCLLAHGTKHGAAALRPVFDQDECFYWECTEDPAHRLMVWDGSNGGHLAYNNKPQSGAWT